MDDKNKELQNGLNKFLEDSNKTPEPNVVVTNETIITPKTGLIERVDKTLLTSDGRQLLLEIY